MRIIVSGSKGKTGSVIADALKSDSRFRVVGEINLGDRPEEILVAGNADILVDFTCADAAASIIPMALKADMHVVSGTTGLLEQDIENIRVISREVGKNVLIAPNFSVGACLMMRMATLASQYFRDYSIVELHHDSKKDRPSGTAKLTSCSISGHIQPERIHSVRLPGLVAHQEVIFGGPGQVLTVRHDSLSRESFVPGVILALEKVADINGVITDLGVLLGA